MARIPTVDPESATGKTGDLFNAVKSRLGIIPNMTRVMANSPAVVEAYLSFSGALAGGLLDARLREQLALIAAQQNHCDYCLSAHTAIGKIVGLNPEQILAARHSEGGSIKATAALTFARRVLDTKGHVSDSDIAAARQATLSDGEITEIIAHVALNIFTNYFNIATQVDVDFPRVSHNETV